MFYAPSAAVIGRSDYPIDLKPGNVLLRPYNLDNIVMHELPEQPGTIYDFPKAIPSNQLPFHPVLSAPLVYGLEMDQRAEFH